MKKSILGDLTEEMVKARCPEQVQTEEQANQMWIALKREMLISRYLKQTGLKRDQIGIV